MTMLNKKELAANAMKDAMAWLDERGVVYLHLPPHQIKIGMINFWPGKGTITVDGEQQRRGAKGLPALAKLLKVDDATNDTGTGNVRKLVVRK